jgi:glycosyltransferase involved in cell wall biosynthesis
MISNSMLSSQKGIQYQARYYKDELMAKKKVLFVIDTLKFGGAEQSLLVNAMYFKNIIPVVCHIYEGDTLKQKFIEKGIKVYSLNLKKRYGFVAAGKLLSNVIKSEQPDLMVAYLTRSEIVTRIVGRFYHIPVVGTFISDLYSKTYNQHLSWKARKVVYLFKLINKLTSRFCVGFVANSQSIKLSSIKQLSVPHNKVEVICRGRESFKFRTRRFEPNRSGGLISFLNVGRLFPIKGQKELIMGFKDFLNIYPDATLSIIGDGPMKEELQQIINTHELNHKVFLLGARNDIPDIIADFDCFVFPSFSEGFSGAIVEAMFAGLPILASDIPQNREAITHLQNGYLFRKESVKEITKAMEWFKENMQTAERFARSAYDFAKENFELENTVIKFENYLFKKMNDSE